MKNLAENSEHNTNSADFTAMTFDSLEEAHLTLATVVLIRPRTACKSTALVSQISYVDLVRSLANAKEIIHQSV